MIAPYIAARLLLASALHARRRRVLKHARELTHVYHHPISLPRPISWLMVGHFSPDDTPEGTLPPFEVAKAYAFAQALSQIKKHTGKSVRQLLGEDQASFISKHLKLKGGGRPNRRTVFKASSRCSEEGWYPGKVAGERTGRPPTFTEHQKQEMARVAMEAKRKLVRPTPACVRSKLPRLSMNKSTEAPASNWTIYKIFHTMCFDEDEDDPWVFMHSPSKDYVSDSMETRRVIFANHVLQNSAAGAWSSHVAIDPCITILPTTRAQSEDQRVAAMGAKKMMSPKSRLKGANLRAPLTARTQGREDEKVHWTPVFALGRVRIYVCDAVAARRDPRLPARLNEGSEMAKFVKHVLPDILVEMQQEYGWSRTPRTVVHDKASYFVASRAQRLATSFADALRGARLKSWLGDADADCNWLAARLGDVYPHETVISHIRRSLDHRFPRCSPGETRSRFANRMQKVQAYMNSEEFAARDGAGLASLAESLRDRCRRLVLLKGERLRS